MPGPIVKNAGIAVGELFILGFFGKVIPARLKEFAACYSSGGVILFDYSC